MLGDVGLDFDQLTRTVELQPSAPGTREPFVALYLLLGAFLEESDGFTLRR